MGANENNAALPDMWIAFTNLKQSSPEYDQLFWIWEHVNHLCSKQPVEAFDFILAVLKLDPSDQVLANLAAGPMEELLGNHPHEMIERVETEVRRNPRLRHLLGGVWQNAMPNDVWLRVQAMGGKRW